MDIIKKILNYLLIRIVIFILFIAPFCAACAVREIFQSNKSLVFVVSIIVLIIYMIIGILAIIDTIFPKNYYKKIDYSIKTTEEINDILESIKKVNIIKNKLKIFIFLFIPGILFTLSEIVNIYSLVLINLAISALMYIICIFKFLSLVIRNSSYSYSASYSSQKSSGNKTYKCLKCGAERRGKYVENFNTSNCAMGGEHEFVEEWRWKIKNRKAN